MKQENFEPSQREENDISIRGKTSLQRINTSASAQFWPSLTFLKIILGEIQRYQKKGLREEKCSRLLGSGRRTFIILLMGGNINRVMTHHWHGVTCLGYEKWRWGWIHESWILKRDVLMATEEGTKEAFLRKGFLALGTAKLPQTNLPQRYPQDPQPPVTTPIERRTRNSLVQDAWTQWDPPITTLQNW